MATNKKGLTEAQLITVGHSIAEQFIKIEVNADGGKRSLLIDFAQQYASDEAKSKAVLTGYHQGFIDLGASDATARVRKSEANAVFQALAKTEVSKDNLKKLTECTGGYHAFIELARELRGKKERTGGTKTVNKMSTIQYDSVETNLGRADVNQLTMVVGQSLQNLHKKAPAQLAGYNTLILIQQAAVSMDKNPAIEDFFKQVAANVLAIVEPAIEQVKKAQETTKDMAEATKNGVVLEQEPEQTDEVEIVEQAA